MKYMLDTNTCIFIIKQDENVLHHLKCKSTRHMLQTSG